MDKKKIKTSQEKPKIEEKDKAIIRELIKNPRIGDNQISKSTGIPVKTVNRRRKYLESSNTINYMTFVNNFSNGTGRFNSIVLYTMFFEYGITTEIVKRIIMSKEYNETPAIIKHIMIDMVGEKEGMATYSFMVTSRAHEDIIEILNADIVPMIKRYLGDGSIKKIEENTIRDINRTGHNNFLLRSFNKEKMDLKDTDIFIWD
ncbi:MAG: AsnC family protein [Candidatus Woesearchaeota archaeon]